MKIIIEPPQGSLNSNSIAIIVVIVIVAIVGLVIFGIDTGLSAIIDALVKLANEREAQQAAVTVQQMISLFMMK